MNKQLLKEVLSVQTASYKDAKMVSYIKSWCKSNGLKCKIINGNIYITKGKSNLYPCYVAHLDTVHRIEDNIDRLSIVEHKGALIALDAEHQQVGIGGDDKVGIYLALRMLMLLPECKVALFKDEEVGCIGSSNANISFFKDCCFILQGDRRGNKDFVTSIGGGDISSEEFQSEIMKLLPKYDMAFSSGAMTDVEALSKKGVGVSCANVSCGYYKPHTEGEYVIVDDVAKIEKLFLEIARKLSGKRWSHKYESIYKPQSVYTKKSYRPIDNDWYYDDSYNMYLGRWDDWNQPTTKRADTDNQQDLFSTATKYEKHETHGLMQLSPMYCPKCIDIQVHERVGNHYFKFYCSECRSFLEQHEPITTEQAINLLYGTDDNITI